jgi:hypothetical protein
VLALVAEGLSNAVRLGIAKMGNLADAGAAPR